MAEIVVSRRDIDSVTQALAELNVPEAPKAMLSAIAAAISEAIGEQDQPVIVMVESDASLARQFDAAFTPDEVVPAVRSASEASEPAAAVRRSGVKVKVMKIGR